MPAATLSATTRYFPVGVRQYYWVPTIVDINNPIRSELDAGTNLTDEIVDGSVQGFAKQPSTIDTPDAGNTFTSTINGRSTAPTNSIAVYTTSDGTTDARDLLTDGLNGFFVIFPEGDHPPVTGPPAKTWHMNIWPVRVMVTADDMDMSKPGQATVSFATSKPPAIRVAVPA